VRPATRWRRRAGRCALAVLALGAAAVRTLLALNLVVTRGIDGLAYDDTASVPIRPVAIVFGAGVADGKPTPALADRIRGGVDLYRSGRVGHLLMTGDNHTAAYDEVTVMRDEAIRQGVPAAAITRDYAGFDTYDSCARARDVFGVREATLVTQDFHLARALFTCRALGLDAVGLRIPDWQHRGDELTYSYPTDMSLGLTAREWVSRAKAIAEVEVLHPDPHFGGPYEGLRPT
jgi:vancomycin permeability regulator SanA